MENDDDRCNEARRFQRMDDAFRRGDLDALRAAVDDPALIPNGCLSAAIGSCLVYSIYHSPLPFIRTLLEMGAKTNAPADDGFPPLIAALTCTRAAPGAAARPDVYEIVSLLLKFGADPNQRGLNDYTPLHMAVAERNWPAVQLLLDAGADPRLSTRIDECERPAALAARMGCPEVAALLDREGRPLGQRLKTGLTLLADLPGSGSAIRRHQVYRMRLRLWLGGGQAVRWQHAWGPVDVARLDDEGTTLTTQVRISRGSMINGLFYGVEGMRVGGIRRLEIAPHLAYGERGVPGVIPSNAKLTAEVTILEAVDWPARRA